MRLPDIFKKEKEKNINLIPKEETGSTFSKKDYIIPILIPILAVGLLVIVFATLFALEQTASAKASDLENQINEKKAQWQKFSKKAQTVKKLNTALGIYQEGTDQNKAFSSYTKKVRSAVPSGVKLTKLIVEESGSVSTRGVSKDPKTIFQFFNVLKGRDQDFSDVELLSISYQSKAESDGGKTQEEGFIFTIDFKVKK